MAVRDIDFCAMNEKRRKSLPQDSSWVLEQIEIGLGQLEPTPQRLPVVPKLSYEQIESAVTRALREELARLDEEDSKR